MQRFSLDDAIAKFDLLKDHAARIGDLLFAPEG